MTSSYDPSNNSIQIPHTFEEYKKAVGLTNNSWQYWVSIDDEISSRTEYRHEHAHFSSFNSTGLIELKSVFEDFKLLIYEAFIYKSIKNLNGKELRIPLIPDKYSTTLTDDQKKFVTALRQINQQEAFFFGWGTNDSAAKLFDFTIQEDFCKQFEIHTLHPGLVRYRKFAKQLLFTTAPHLMNNKDAMMPKFLLDGEMVNLTSRAVIEAYAITIEVFSEHIKTMYTGEQLKKHLEGPPKRMPNVSNLIPIRLILSTITNEEIAIEDYVRCQIPVNSYRLYHCVSLITIAAMQVPVLEDYEAESIFMGSIKQLCPAHRLAHILSNIENGTLKNPIEIKDYYNNNELLEWIDSSLKSIGDPWTIKFYQNISDIVSENWDSYGIASQVYSMHKTSWVGRMHFFNNPSQFTSEAGIMLYDSAFQIRYVKTSDGHIIGFGVADDEILLHYLRDSVSHLFEAICLGDSWEECWRRLGLFPKDNSEIKKYLLAPLIFYLNKRFSDYEETRKFIPSLKIS